MRVGLFQPVHASPSAFLKAFCVFILVVLLRRWVHSAMNGKSWRELVCVMCFSFLFQFYYVNLSHGTTNGYKNAFIIAELFSGNFLLCLKSSINTWEYCCIGYLCSILRLGAFWGEIPPTFHSLRFKHYQHMAGRSSWHYFTFLPCRNVFARSSSSHLFEKICSVVRLKCEWVCSSLLKGREHKGQGDWKASCLASGIFQVLYFNHQKNKISVLDKIFLLLNFPFRN